MTKDRDALILAARRVKQWLDDGCPSWGSPEGDIRKLVEVHLGMGAEEFAKTLYEQKRDRLAPS